MEYNLKKYRINILYTTLHTMLYTYPNIMLQTDYTLIKNNKINPLCPLRTFSDSSFL